MRRNIVLLIFMMSVLTSFGYSLNSLRNMVSNGVWMSNSPIESIYLESFEEWDGSTVDWLPADWTEIVSNEDYRLNNDGVFTWHVGQQKNNKPYPVDGQFYANIYYAYETLEDGTTVDLPQDEWLITPTYDIKSEDIFKFSLGFSPLFLYNLNNEYIDWGKMEFRERFISATIKVYIREVDSVNDIKSEWIELLDISNSWNDVSLEDLFNNYLDATFYQYELDLSDYADKSVELAFRYVGMYGNTMELDAIYIDRVVNDVSVIENDPISFDVYGIDGRCVLKNVNYSDIENLPKGIYIINKEKVLVR